MVNQSIDSLPEEQFNQEWAKVLKTLKYYWGYDSFRSPQDDVVRSLIRKRDALIVLPTGHGKSVCFQLPALLNRGVTLVICPLTALMEDQVKELEEKGLSAAALHSELRTSTQQYILRRLEDNRLRLLYLSPETLLGPKIWPRLQDPNLLINGLMIDEAHTLVHWGESFRPDFRRLGTVREALGKRFPVAAFTATADPYTEAVLGRVLNLQDPSITRVNPLRSNLHLSIQTSWTVDGRRRTIANYIQHNQGSSGLVYVRTRKDALQLSEWFQQQGLRAKPYHGGLAPDQRRVLEAQWKAGSQPFLVCTNAFGMGINKRDVRWVAHYQPPMSVIDYVQEVGRGGRDGQVSTALMMVSSWLDSMDDQQQQFFLNQKQKQQEEAVQLLGKLPESGSVKSVVMSHGKPAKLALSLLHQSGCLTWTDPFHFLLTQRPKRLPSLIPDDVEPLYGDPLWAMEQLIHTRECRWQRLLVGFGYPPGDPCGVCDNCRRSRRKR